MFRNNKKANGFTLVEVAAALSVLGILLAGLAVSLDGFRRFNHYQLVRQRCIAAARAQFDSLTVIGKPIRDQDFKRLWPGLSVSIQQSAGTGQWEGMKLVKVTVNGKSFRKQVKIQFHRYILGEPKHEKERLETLIKKKG